jgi:2,3-dihydroxybenzoate decarboxylase
MKKIVLEEHFSTPAMSEYATDVVSTIDRDFLNYVKPRLMDVEQMRLEDMDKNGIAMCVLSVTSPGVQLEPDTRKAIDTARGINDLLGVQMAKYPTRYSGFAHLAMQDAKAAADELERCVTQLGMRGALINGHTNGEYLDDEKFWPVWERAEALEVPVYLHPADAPLMPKNEAGYSEMAGPGWSWGSETAGHVLRIIYGGVFDRFPKTTLVLGHMGETLPFILWRLDSRYKMLKHTKNIAMLPSEYIRRNVMVTTAGSFSAAPLLCTLAALGSDRIMLSVDYPYEYTAEAVHFIENAPISELDREKICHGNVERLLKL